MQEVVEEGQGPRATAREQRAYLKHYFASDVGNVPSTDRLVIVCVSVVELYFIIFSVAAMALLSPGYAVHHQADLLF